MTPFVQCGVWILNSVEHFKEAYDNKAFTLGHCWSVMKDSKKLEDSFALWQ
jgi:hypothetical protein